MQYIRGNTEPPVDESIPLPPFTYPPWARDVPPEPFTATSLESQLDGAMLVHRMHATVRIASEEIQYETTIAARCDIDTCTLWIREEYVKHNADRSISTHWVEWLPFWSYQASGRFARFDYPPTSSPPNWMSDITLPGSSEQTDISITVTAMMDPRPFCDHLHTDFYTFNDIKIGTAWLAHVGLA